MVKKVTTKSTKAEILEAFDELNQEKATLETQIKQLQKEIKTAPVNTAPIPAQVSPQPQKSAMTSTQQTKSDLNLILKNLETLQVGFGSAVSSLSEQLIKEASTLAEIQNSVAEEQEQLEELHELSEIEENTLGTLIADYETSSKAFLEELNTRRETLEQEAQAARKAWEKEQELHDATIAERNTNYQVGQERDEAEYTYTLQLERQLDQEEYDQEKKQRYQELAEAKSLQEKEWEEREKAIAEREKAHREAQEKVTVFEANLEQKKKEGQEEGYRIGVYQAKVRHDLREKEIEGEKRNYALRIQGLEQTIQLQETRLQSLAQQLDSALKQVQDLAVKAIEGTSNRNSFDALKEIAIEQAKNQQKGK
ncbi:hypothetical protein K4A83_15245 [Spirulina subsalsa FACHB-351]|uniref:Myosin heavy chain n=1 Tax=Spirulina subsalsa FACHB-351 TaxID=234711 RepID=A0ABT3L7Y8_9CYAN|nr:hypothetical protein [Spirulina subsalsa]MCW6037620.1 hypothetical protein [Spirulina subsalsa FACHB-351]